MYSWNDIFKAKGRVFLEPQKELVSFISKLKNKKSLKILDLGCGSGRHTVYFAKEGFDTYATDVSPVGIKMTQDWLTKEGLRARIQNSSCFETFPFEAEFFDNIVSTRVIYHNYHAEVLKCISEIERVLKKGGYLFIMVPDQRYKNRKLVLKQVESHTFIPETGDEIGIPHVIYDDELINSDFKNFKIIKIEHSSEDHYCLTVKKL